MNNKEIMKSTLKMAQSAAVRELVGELVTTRKPYICPECGHPLKEHEDNFGCTKLDRGAAYCSCELSAGEVALLILGVK